MSGPGLTITCQPPVEAEARLSDAPLAARDLWRALLDLRSGSGATTDLPHVLVRALRETVADRALGGRPRATLDEDLRDELDVTALDGAYADAAARALRRRDGDETPLWEFLRLTRQLGRQTTLGLPSSLDDVREGPLQLLAHAEPTPTVVIGLPEDWWDARRNQRERWLAFVRDLAGVLDVRLATTTLDATRLATEHRSDLPAGAVNSAANPRVEEGRSAAVEETASAALDALGRDGPHVQTLRCIADHGPSEVAYACLYADGRLDVSDSAVRHRVRMLADHDLVATLSIDGDRHVDLRPAGEQLLAWLDADAGDAHDASVGRADAEDETTGADDPAALTSAAGNTNGVSEPAEIPERLVSDTSVALPVNDPRNCCACAVLRPARGREGGPSTGAADAAAGRGGGGGAVEEAWLPARRHHAFAAAAPSQGLSLDDRPLDEWDDPRGSRVSWAGDREELVVAVEWDGPVSAAVRLCAALTSDRVLNTALTPERLDSAEEDLGGLVESDAFVLRKTRCLGWLDEDHADGEAFVDRLRTAREEILRETNYLRDASGDYNADVAKDVLRDAHGLIGTVTQLLDLLGVDLVRQIRLPDYSRNLHDKRETIVRFLATATSIASRYGHYSGYRVLHEERDGKREDLLGAPEVLEPTGDLIGSWVLTGPGVDRLRPALTQLEERGGLDVQDDATNFAAFAVDVPVVDAWRRDAVAETLARLGRMKRLDPTRRAVSLLHSLLGSTVDVADVIGALGGQDAGRGRDLDLAELRYGLASLDADRLLPDMSQPALSAVLSTLLDASERLSRREIAERAGVSKRSVSSKLDVLATLGLLDERDEGEGRTVWYRLRLPTRDERRDEDRPLPRYLGTDERDLRPTPEDWRIHDVVDEALERLADVVLARDAPETWWALVEGDCHVGRLVEQWPVLAPFLEPLVAMVCDGERTARMPPGPAATATMLGQHPGAEQTTLDEPSASAGGTPRAAD